MVCNKCNNEMKLIPAGVSKKTGNSYAAFFACEVCNPRRPAPQSPIQTPPPNLDSPYKQREPTNRKADHKTMILAYAKDLAVAKINKGDDVDPAVYTINIYKLLLKAYEGIETPEGSFDV